MSLNRKKSRSEILRTIIHTWIERNPEILQNNYDIIFKDIVREIRLEPKIKDVEAELLNSFKRTKKISIDRLASIIDVNSDDLIRFIEDHGDDLEQKGLNLLIDGEYIVKT